MTKRDDQANPMTGTSSQHSVSIIVAAYNAQDSIARCLSSLVGQTGKNLQIIVVEDGSTDNTPAICDDFARSDSRVTILHEANSGVSHARNAGIDVASNEYIMFCDADDWLDPSAIEDATHHLRDGYLTTFGYAIHNENPNSSKRAEIDCVFGKDATQTVKAADFYELATKSLFNPVWNKVYEKARLDSFRIRFDESISIGEDALFNIAYMQTGIDGFLVINEPLYNYSAFKPGSLDNSYNKAFADAQVHLYGAFAGLAASLGSDDEYQERIVFDELSSLMVAFDKLYRNKVNMDKRDYANEYARLEAILVRRFRASRMSTKHRGIASMRIALVKHRLFPLDHHVRSLAKRVLGVA